MNEYQFDGDINDLSVDQRELIADVFKVQGFKNVKIEVQPVGKEGDNFVANVKRMIVTKDGETFKIIGKVAPKNEELRTIRKTATYFQNEHVMYTKVLPKFTELEKTVNVSEEERLRYATCYGTYLKAPNEIILLEDLEVTGFKMLNKFTPLSDETVKLVLKNFATLHSLSYALKYQQRHAFEKFCKELVNIWEVLGEVSEMTDYFEKLNAEVHILMDDNRYKNAVKNATVQVISRAQELAKIDSSSKFSVIQQGDSWTNNIMFKLTDDKAVECCMIDYQLSKQSSPVADLHYMIFNCTDHATRMKHFHDWIDYYYSELDKRLAKFELKTDEVYPKYQLEADLKMFAEFSLGHAIMLAALVFRETADTGDLVEATNDKEPNKYKDDTADKNKFTVLRSVTVNKLKARLEQVIDSFIEFGYLSNIN